MLIIHADLECLLKKCNLVKITLKILTQRKKWSTNLQDTHGVQYARLMIQKTDAIFIGEKIYCKVPRVISIVFHNGSTYDYHFIIKTLAEFNGEFKCLRENIEKYTTFSVPLKKEKGTSKKMIYKVYW